MRCLCLQGAGPARRAHRRAERESEPRRAGLGKAWDQARYAGARAAAVPQLGAPEAQITFFEALLVCENGHVNAPGMGEVCETAELARVGGSWGT